MKAADNYLPYEENKEKKVVCKQERMESQKEKKKKDEIRRPKSLKRLLK